MNNDVFKNVDRSFVYNVRKEMENSRLDVSPVDKRKKV